MENIDFDKVNLGSGPSLATREFYDLAQGAVPVGLNTEPVLGWKGRGDCLQRLSLKLSTEKALMNLSRYYFI